MTTKLTCNHCGGPVFYDIVADSEKVIDLFCLMHGKRWHIKKSNPLARWILELRKR